MPSEVELLADRYALHEPLARGGMGVVWRATDQVLARPVAVKLLHPHLSGDAEFLERFRFEALAAARLTHPGIVAIFDTGQVEGDALGDRHYIVMEYCGGGTLAQLLATQGPLDAAYVADLGATMCEALGYAHSMGIVHRDIKPANLLLTEDGALKVGDFGIAKAAFRTGDITTTGAILGTVTYLSPEQATGGEPGPRSDLYGVGVVLYELAVGRPPFMAESQLAIAMKHMNEPPPAPRSIRPGVPRALEDVILTALRKNPDDRFATAEDMRAALLGLAGAGGTTSALPNLPREQPPPRAPVRPRDTRWLTPVAALILLAVVIASAASIFADDRPAAPGASPAAVETESGPVEPKAVTDFDPHGTGEGEHPDEVPLATDGREDTAWTSEEYGTPLQSLKPGVGILFDLGREVEVERVEIASDTPGYDLEIRSGGGSPDTEESLEVVEQLSDAPREADVETGGVAARYWLVWITSLPGDAGGIVRLSEVRFFGR